MKRIRISSGKVSLEADLRATPTADRLWETLPIQGKAQRWGQEVYFAIPVQAQQEPDARTKMAVGELGYWPPGSAFCIFFGPTPASEGEGPVAASAVNVLGKVLGDATAFAAVKSGAAVRIERVEE